VYQSYRKSQASKETDAGTSDRRSNQKSWKGDGRHPYNEKTSFGVIHFQGGLYDSGKGTSENFSFQRFL
jgi:hypothetical protein